LFLSTLRTVTSNSFESFGSSIIGFLLSKLPQTLNAIPSFFFVFSSDEDDLLCFFFNPKSTFCFWIDSSIFGFKFSIDCSIFAFDFSFE
jgi:hypothetical protein